MKKNGLIVGYGVVGHNLHKELAKLNLDVYDKFKVDNNTKRDIKYDYAFICVDTPYNDKGYCDMSAVEDAIVETNADILIIKSTVLPGSTEQFSRKYNKRIVFSPEYYGGTQHCNNFNFNFTILGGDKETCCEVQQILQSVYDGTHIFRIVDSKTAELVKYMENSFLATKVSFCNAFYEIAKSIGVHYEELRELFVLDPRVNPSHTFVYDDAPYWNSHCLNKDVPAIAYNSNNEFLENVIKYNNQQKQKYQK